jgi:glycosyltransferase involved in cell wall biosynthesis
MTGALSRVKASLLFRTRQLLRSAAMTRVLRWRAQRRGWQSDGSVTVVIVTWNTAEQLAVAVHAVRRFSPAQTRLVVVDNASTDGTRQLLARLPDVRCIRLPVNVGHGAAFDIAALTAHTEFIVALDVDAFPLADGWLDRLIAPLHTGNQVSGVLVNRPYAHPCTMAMRTERFARQRHTLTADWAPDGLGETHWDAGELISMREQPAVALVERSWSYGPGWLGTVWDGLTFHCFYTARRSSEPADASQPDDVLDPDDGVTRGRVAEVWDQACRELLGLDAAARQALLS